MADDPEALVKRYSELVEERDWDGLRDHVTDDFVFHDSPSIKPNPVDIEEHIETLKPFDWRIELLDIFSDEGRVATRERIHAVQIESFQGVPPSGDEVTIDSILIWRVEDGKVAENWSSPDTYAMMDQLGLTFPAILITLPKMLLRKLRA